VHSALIDPLRRLGPKTELRSAKVSEEMTPAVKWDIFMVFSWYFDGN
jgi:hypothetical protein